MVSLGRFIYNIFLLYIVKQPRLKRPFWMVFGFWMVPTILNQNIQNGRFSLGRFTVYSKNILYIKRPRLERPFWKFGFRMDHSKTEHPNTEHENVRYSNGFGFRAFGIRAPTVYLFPQVGFKLKYLGPQAVVLSIEPTCCLPLLLSISSPFAYYFFWCKLASRYLILFCRSNEVVVNCQLTRNINLDTKTHT